MRIGPRSPTDGAGHWFTMPCHWRAGVARRRFRPPPASPPHAEAMALQVIGMTESLFPRIVEITFTSFMVPTLLVPVVWIAGLLLRGRMRGNEKPAVELDRHWRILLRLVLLWL